MTEQEIQQEAEKYQIEHLRDSVTTVEQIEKSWIAGYEKAQELYETDTDAEKWRLLMGRMQDQAENWDVDAPEDRTWATVVASLVDNLIHANKVQL